MVAPANWVLATPLGSPQSRRIPPHLEVVQTQESYTSEEALHVGTGADTAVTLTDC